MMILLMSGINIHIFNNQVIVYVENKSIINLLLKIYIIILN